MLHLTSHCGLLKIHKSNWFSCHYIHARDYDSTVKADTHEGFRSWSKAPSCVLTISWLQSILGSRIATPQNAP